MRRLRVRKAARAEIREALQWYFARSPRAAARFFDAVDAAMLSIAESPDRYPIVHGNLRRVLLRRFPYAVYYKIFPTVISVVGVIHGRRHPVAWLRGG